MRNFYFTENTIKFFKNYLTNRTQCTSINNIKSQELKITHGVPQGSILGPILFLLYINNIGQSINFSKYKLFADDTTIYHSEPDFDTCLSKLTQDLISINNWCDNNNMAINLKKQKLWYLVKNVTLKKFKKLIFRCQT